MAVKEIKSDKYQGWTIVKETAGADVTYVMTRPGSGHAIVVEADAAGVWSGRLMMVSPNLGMLVTPLRRFAGSVAECVVEADGRRERAAQTAAWLDANGREPWGAEARKLRGDNSRQPGTFPGQPRFRRAI